MGLFDQLEMIQLSEITNEQVGKAPFDEQGTGMPCFLSNPVSSDPVLNKEKVNHRDALAQNHEFSIPKNVILSSVLPENESKGQFFRTKLPQAETNFPSIGTHPRKSYTQNIKIRSACESFSAGFPWIQKHLVELKAKGWTSPALFRRSPFGYPLGPWGAAWLWPTGKTGLTVKITGDGHIRFTFTSPGKRKITQTIYLQSPGRFQSKKNRQKL